MLLSSKENILDAGSYHFACNLEIVGKKVLNFSINFLEMYDKLREEGVLFISINCMAVAVSCGPVPK